MGHAQWQQSFSDRIIWFGEQSFNAAQMHLFPPELGPIDVRIQMNNDQASILFSSQHASVRDSIENAIPRLREAMQSAGLNLADVNVSDQSLAREHQGSEDNKNGLKSSEVLAGIEESLLQREEAINALASSIIDLYA